MKVNHKIRLLISIFKIKIKRSNLEEQFNPQTFFHLINQKYWSQFLKHKITSIEILNSKIIMIEIKTGRCLLISSHLKRLIINLGPMT